METKIPKLAIIAGNGSIPFYLVEECKNKGREYCLIIIDGHAKKLSEKYCLIGDVRGSGLFLAIELVINTEKIPATQPASIVVQGLKDRGVLTNTIGPYSNILKLRPPMIFSKENSDFFLDALDQILQEVDGTCFEY